jgi:hypothetical protein
MIFPLGQQPMEKYQFLSDRIQELNNPGDYSRVINSLELPSAKVDTFFYVHSGGVFILS